MEKETAESVLGSQSYVFVMYSLQPSSSIHHDLTDNHVKEEKGQERRGHCPTEAE
jgi:hypothetical protein